MQTHQCDGKPFLQLSRIWHREPNRSSSGPDHGQLRLHALGVPHLSHTHRHTHANTLNTPTYKYTLITDTHMCSAITYTNSWSRQTSTEPDQDQPRPGLTQTRPDQAHFSLCLSLCLPSSLAAASSSSSSSSSDGDGDDDDEADPNETTQCVRVLIFNVCVFQISPLILPPTHAEQERETEYLLLLFVSRSLSHSLTLQSLLTPLYHPSFCSLFAAQTMNLLLL